MYWSGGTSWAVAQTTEELWPGYQVSTAAYVISLFLPEIIRDLKLKTYGLKILPRTPSSYTPLLDGRSLTLGPDPGLCQREISKFSHRDADAYPRYSQLLERVAEVLEPMLSQVAPDPLPLPKHWRSVGVGKRLRDTTRLWSLHQSLASLGDQLPEAIELLTGAARPILERWFESEVLRATLATDAIIGAFDSISAPGTAYVLLHHVMGEAGGARGVWGYVQGGMGGLADALAGVCRDQRVEIHREAEVQRIITSGNHVTGVGLADGTQLEAPVVASSVDAHLTFEKFMTADQLPEFFRQAVSRISYSSASAKLNLALAEPPNFSADPSNGIAPHHRGTMHISPTLEYIEKAYDDAKYGRPSAEPILEMTLPTSVDDTIAPEGHHIMSVFIQFAPYRLANGSWDEIKDEFADRCIDAIGRYAPNLPGASCIVSFSVRWIWSGPMGSRVAISCREPWFPINYSRCDPCRDGPIIGPPSKASIFAAPPAIPVVVSWVPVAEMPQRRFCVIFSRNCFSKLPS